LGEAVLRYFLSYGMGGGLMTAQTIVGLEHDHWLGIPLNGKQEQTIQRATREALKAESRELIHAVVVETTVGVDGRIALSPNRIALCGVKCEQREQFTMWKRAVRTNRPRCPDCDELFDDAMLEEAFAEQKR